MTGKLYEKNLKCIKTSEYIDYATGEPESVFNPEKAARGVTEIALKLAKDFTEWQIKNYSVAGGDEEGVWYYKNEKYYTTDELLQEYIKTLQ